MKIRNAIVSAMILVGCGGSTPPATIINLPPPPPPVQGSVPLKAGTYKAKAASGQALAAVGPAIDTTLITDGAGVFLLSFPNYDLVRGAMLVKADSSVEGTGTVNLFTVDGQIRAATLAGTSDGTTITGTVNGANAFSLALADTVLAHSFTLAEMAGTYASTSNSNGLWIVIALDGTENVDNIRGFAYNSKADADAGGATNLAGGGKAVGRYVGSILPPSIPGGPYSYTVNPDAFRIGFQYTDISTGAQPPASSGFGSFTLKSLIAVTVNTVNGSQLTAEFAKL